MSKNWASASSGTRLESTPHTCQQLLVAPSQAAMLIKPAPMQKAHGFTLGPSEFSIKEPTPSSLSTFCPASFQL